MKINTEALNAIQQQEKTQNWKKSSGNFDQLLTQELGKTEQTSAGAPAVPVLGNKVYGPALLEKSGFSTEQQVMNNIESILNKWEEYADKLGGPEAEESLRQAYTVLSSISNDVQGVKEALETLEQEHPGLKTLVNEMEVLAVTEQYKFNRGDYV